MPATVLNTFIRLVDQLWWGPWPGQQVKEALEGHLPLVFYVRKYTNKNIIKVDVTIYYLKGILCADIDCILGKMLYMRYALVTKNFLDIFRYIKVTTIPSKKIY